MFVIKSAVDTYVADSNQPSSYTDDPTKAQQFRFYLQARELAFDSERVVWQQTEESDE
jgi:hypothetical protein